MTNHQIAEVFPPGEFIKDEIDARGWSQSDLAEILGRPVQAVNEIIAGKKAITPETAKELGDAFGTGAEFWLNLESKYRLAEVAGTDTGVVRRARLYEKGPVREMIRRGWLSASEDVSVLENELTTFFELATIDDRPAFEFAAKKSTYDDTSASQIAWCYRAKQLASRIRVSEYSEENIAEIVRRLRISAATADGVRSVPKVLADGGIRFVIVEPLKSTKIDGAAFWLDETFDRPVIALSMRYDRIDNFWFVLGHELAHIKNRDRSIDVELVGVGAQRTESKPTAEKKADEMAASFLINASKMQQFVARHSPKYSKAVIRGFAEKLGVHPGIVVGQLQYRDEISYSHSRDFLVPVRGEIVQVAASDGWR